MHIVCAWPWLGPPLTELQYVVRYVLPVYSWCHLFTPWDQWAESRKALCLEVVRQVAVPYKFDVRQLQCLAEFVRMRHRRRSLLSTVVLSNGVTVKDCCLPAKETLPWSRNQQHEPSEEQSSQYEWHDQEHQARTDKTRQTTTLIRLFTSNNLHETVPNKNWMLRQSSLTNMK